MVKKARVSKPENLEFRLENFILGLLDPKKSIGGKFFTPGGVVSELYSIENLKNLVEGVFCGDVPFFL